MPSTLPNLRLLFDHNVPAALRRSLGVHETVLADEVGWATITNGELIAAAEREGFNVLITADKRIRYRQNLSNRRIAILVLSTNQWSAVREHAALVSAAVDRINPGEYREVELPAPRTDKPKQKKETP